jgi:hypothetical protein
MASSEVVGQALMGQIKSFNHVVIDFTTKVAVFGTFLFLLPTILAMPLLFGI